MPTTHRTRMHVARRLRTVGLWAVAWCCCGCASAPFGSSSDWTATGCQGMVASDHPLASEVGLAVLEDGGNAIDAAVATSLALAVTRPYSTGLGGGGFLLYWEARTQKVYVLDYREQAPVAASPHMFERAQRDRPDAPPASKVGGLAVGGPGLLDGLDGALQRFGSQTLEDLAEPAYELAAQGFRVDEHHLDAARTVEARLRSYPSFESAGEPLRRRHLFDGVIPSEPPLLRQPELAEALQLIGRDGVNAFYRGPIGQEVVLTARRYGGLLQMEDLRGYRPVWREPIKVTYRDTFDVYSMPPPSSGGICIAETLNILEHWELAELQKKDPARAAHVTVAALSQAFEDRAEHLGDADFVKVPVHRLTGKSYAAEIAERIRGGSTHDDAMIAAPPNDGGTSHYCVVDQWGNVVAATETINTEFGSLLMTPRFGIVLNNEMDDFTAEPGKANAFGLIQSAQNAAATRKRPLSSMSPTIVVRDGQPILALGASGGPRIITSVLQVMLAVLEQDAPIGKAVAAPRLHHQWRPDVVYRNEFSADHAIIRGLAEQGYEISDEQRMGVVQAIRIDDGTFTGASDPRKGGRPAGF